MTRETRTPSRDRWLRRVTAMCAAVLVGLVSVAPAHAAEDLPDVPETTDIALIDLPGEQPADVAAVEAAGTAIHLQFVHSGRCIDNPGYSIDKGTWLDQWNCVSQTNEQWYFKLAGRSHGYDFYMIRNRYSGLCLNVAGASTSNNAHVIQWPCNRNSTNNWFSVWQPPGSPDGAALLWAAHSGKCINVPGANVANGAKLIQWTCGYYDNEFVRRPVW